VHEIRKRLAAEHGFDIKAIFANIYKGQALQSERLVSPRKRTDADGSSAPSPGGDYFGQ
jgi:hypothetical protein